MNEGANVHREFAAIRAVFFDAGVREANRIELRAVIGASNPRDGDKFIKAHDVATSEKLAGKAARQLSDDEVLKVIVREAKKRREAAEAFTTGGRRCRAHGHGSCKPAAIGGR